MAKRRITQETFDAAVRENMEEFEMDPDEALREAVEQFESQGVELSCIVKAVPAVSSEDKQEEQTHEVLTDGQPDLLDAEGQQFLLDVLKKYRAVSCVTRVAIHTVRHCCLKHEQNRQDLVKGGVLPLMTVTFGHAHEHAKSIVLEHNGLKVLIEAAKAHFDNTSVLSELCATLSRLAVRNEFCQDVCDLGGLKIMMTLLADSYESPELVRQVLSAIRAIAGNDDVKDMVVNAGGVQLIVIAMNRHMSNPAVCEQGCACLSVLALRKPNNCKVIMENGGALAAIQSMKTHSDVVNVQKQACMLMRNLVSRMQNYSQPILEMGAGGPDSPGPKDPSRLWGRG
ncbi:Armadillo repeat-containing protein 6 [Larimichthys crocea]|uniref:Uncharacterized protein n=1 Tax=Larimichthys crocea TaxID=215358 RepID=A0ACD3QRC6_LARCR|nr:Armadillo repeat-containing protein 6 [Larimichthys crocea]